jgi:hypothetical protein
MPRASRGYPASISLTDKRISPTGSGEVRKRCPAGYSRSGGRCVKNGRPKNPAEWGRAPAQRRRRKSGSGSPAAAADDYPYPATISRTDARISPTGSGAERTRCPSGYSFDGVNCVQNGGPKKPSEWRDRVDKAIAAAKSAADSGVWPPPGGLPETIELGDKRISPTRDGSDRQRCPAGYRKVRGSDNLCRLHDVTLAKAAEWRFGSSIIQPPEVVAVAADGSLTSPALGGGTVVVTDDAVEFVVSREISRLIKRHDEIFKNDDLIAEEATKGLDDTDRLEKPVELDVPKWKFANDKMEKDGTMKMAFIAPSLDGVPAKGLPSLEKLPVICAYIFDDTGDVRAEKSKFADVFSAAASVSNNLNYAIPNALIAPYLGQPSTSKLSSTMMIGIMTLITAIEEYLK